MASDRRVLRVFQQIEARPTLRGLITVSAGGPDVLEALWADKNGLIVFASDHVALGSPQLAAGEAPPLVQLGVQVAVRDGRAHRRFPLIPRTADWNQRELFGPADFRFFVDRALV